MMHPERRTAPICIAAGDERARDALQVTFRSRSTGHPAFEIRSPGGEYGLRM